MQRQHGVEDCVGVGLKQAGAVGGARVNIVGQALVAHGQQLLAGEHLLAGGDEMHVQHLHAVKRALQEAGLHQVGEGIQLLAATAGVEGDFLHLNVLANDFLDRLGHLLAHGHNGDAHLVAVLVAHLLDGAEQLLEYVDVEAAAQAVVATEDHQCHTLHIALGDER